MSLSPDSRVLDIPTGTGRHALLFAKLGHKVTIADIDGDLVHEAARLTGGGGATLDATAPLPFPTGWFDLAVIVDFVAASLLSQMETVIRPGGWLVYESYSAQGGNWKQLLPQGLTTDILAPAFEFVEFSTRPAGPMKTEAEAVKLLARRRRV